MGSEAWNGDGRGIRQGAFPGPGGEGVPADTHGLSGEILANHYYNHNKAWIPGKNVEKLQMLVSQQQKREAFLKILDL